MNVIINYIIQQSGAWEEVPGIPNWTRAWSMQLREQGIFEYHWQNQDAFWTVKDGQVRSGSTPFPSGRLFVRGTVENVIELECATAVRA